MKNVMRIVLLLLFSIVLVSCGDVTVTLDAPQNVVITSGVVTWDAVTDAESYLVVVDSESYSVTVRRYDLKTLTLTAGEHTVHVIAQAGTEVSLPSTQLIYTVATATIGVPQNVTITNGVVSWSAVTGARSYVVKVDTVSYTVTTVNFDLKTLALTAGNHTISVQSKNGTVLSLASASVTYVVPASSLGVPQNVAIANGIVTWNAVTGATGYVVYVDLDDYPVTAATFDLNTLLLPPGTYSVFVTATTSTSVSTASVSVSYTVPTANAATIYAAALLAMDPMYLPNMEETDFEDSKDYQQYTMMSQLAQAYSDTAVAMGMTELQAIAMIGHVASTPMRMQTINNLTGMMNEIDSYDIYGLDSVKLANMIYELGKVGISIHMDDLVIKIADAQQEVLDRQADLAAIQATVNFSAIRAQLVPYATTDQLALFDEFISGNVEETGWILSELYWIASDLRYNYEYHYPYYLDYENEYISMFYYVLENARAQNNLTLLETFINDYPLQDVYMLSDYARSVMYAQENFEDYTNELVMMTELFAFMGTDKTMLVEAFTGVADYLSLVYDTVPTSLIALVDDLAANGELTMTEYIALKDEVINVLLTTLPSEADFASVYTMLFTLGNVFEFADFDPYFDYADFLGEVDHAVIEIGLTFLGEIDQTTVEDVMDLVDGLIVEEQIDFVNTGYYNMEQVRTRVDFVKAVELAVYVGNYLETFKDDHSVLFANLDTLQADAQVKELVLLFGETAKTALASELDPDEYAMVEMVIDEVLANYDTYMAAADIMNTIGMNVIDEFLTTSGQMLLDLYDIMENGTGDFDDPLFVADIQAIFAQMTDYVDVITSELDSDSIHTLLSALSVAIKIELMMVSDLDDADIEELIDLSLVPATALLDIMFTFMGYIDDQTAIDLLLLGNEMIIPGEYVVDMYGYGYYEPNSIDFPVAVEFVVYLGNFLRDFQTDHMATLEAFNDLFTDGDIEDLITLVTGLALDQMELEMDPADFEMVSIVVDDVLADYDDIIAALEIIKTIGGNLIDEFLTSEGELFLDLYDLMNNVADPSNPAFIYDILDLFGQFVSYNTAVMGELDAASIQQLLGLVRIPLKVQLMMEEEMTETEAEAFITAMMTPVATALANVVTLEQALVASIDGMDATIAASALWTSLTEEERLMALAVKTLDDMLTTANESLIFATITIIQNDILKNADMLLMTGMVAVDIDAGVADLVSLLTDIFAEVHVVADFNFLMITGPQITQLHELFEMLPSGDTPT